MTVMTEHSKQVIIGGTKRRTNQYANLRKKQAYVRSLMDGVRKLKESLAEVELLRADLLSEIEVQEKQLRLAEGSLL
jgi:hypothetical protein